MTGTTSSANAPLAHAAAARWWLWAAKRSWSARDTSHFAAMCSAASPMCQFSNGHHSPSWIRASTAFWSPYLQPVPHAVQQVRGAAHALHAAGDDEVRVAGADRLGREHHRLQPGAAHLVRRCTPAIVSGSPATSAACRAGVWPTPACTTLPMITSSTCRGCTFARFSASAMATAPSLRRRQVGQPAEELADRRADGGEDERVHVEPTYLERRGLLLHDMHSAKGDAMSKRKPFASPDYIETSLWNHGEVRYQTDTPGWLAIGDGEVKLRYRFDYDHGGDPKRIAEGNVNIACFHRITDSTGAEWEAPRRVLLRRYWCIVCSI